MRYENSPISRSRVARPLPFAGAVALLLCLLNAGFGQSAPRAMLVTRLPSNYSNAIDTGLMPTSQRLALTLTLAPSADRITALDTLLAGQMDPSSKSYRQWVTPQQFAASYGASADQIAQATAWLEAQGLSVDAVSAGGTRLSVSGFAGQVQTAFAVELHNYQVAGHVWYANSTQPSLPSEAAATFSSIDGLSNLPQDLRTALAGPSAIPLTLVNGAASSLAVPVLAAIVDANAVPVLSLDSTFGAERAAPSRVAAYESLFRQAAAQGMTTLLTRSASSGGIPSGLPEVTVVARVEDNADDATPFAARPTWQVAQGLPTDGMRYAPDLTATSFSDFVQAVAGLALKNGGRLGNINAAVYELAPIAGVYTQADGAPAGTWEAASGLGTVDPVKFAQAFAQGTGTSVMSITSSATSPTHGQSFMLSVTSQSTNGGPLPTGTITFTSPQAGFTSSSTNLNGNGMASSPSYLLPGGTYSITANYSGDANYAAQSSSITVTVQPEAAVFTISAPATVSLGSTITATVTLSSASGVGTPSANVMVTPSGITGAVSITQTVAGSGGSASSTFTFTTKQAGSVSLQASCTSTDPSFTCYTPQTATTTVPQVAPTIVLSVTPANPTAGQQVTLAAAVTGVAGIGTTGSVQFFDGGSSLGVGSAPNAQYIGTLAPGNSHVLTAVYQGDANYLKATSNAVNTSVSTATTTTTVSASATSASYGQSVTLNITVSPSTVVNGTQPTGTLTFTGAGSTSTSTVSGGSANVTLNNLAVGTYTIGTSYSGDTNYSASTGNVVTITVTQSTATLNAQISSTSFTTGSSSTLTVTVTLPGNSQLPAGSTFIATITGVTGASYTGTFAVNVGGNTGTGAVIIPAPIAGSYTLQVTCGANTNFTCAPSSLSLTSTATVASTMPTGTTVTTTTLAISPIAPAVGQTITLTATISAAAAAITANAITGTVNFYDGTTLLGSGTIALVGGVATATATTTLTGTTAHALTAVYQGSTVYAQSTSAVGTLTLSAAAAAVSLASNVTSSIAGTSVVLTATVSGSTTTGAAPTGTVTFYLATPALTAIGTASLGTTGNGVGTAVFSTSNLPAGTLTIYATYNGDANFSSATSNTISLGLSDYTVAFVPQTITVTQGQTGTTTAVVSVINGFPGTVVLGCTPQPDLEITCGFNPTVLMGGGSSTLTVTTAVAKAQLERGRPMWLETAGGVSLAAMLCCLLPSRRRRVPVLLLVLLALGMTFSVGCAGNNFNLPASATLGGTPHGTTLLVINTAGTNGTTTVRHNYTFQVTVQ